MRHTPKTLSFPPSMLAQLEVLAELWTKGEGNPPPTDRWSRWRWTLADVVRHACTKLIDDRARDVPDLAGKRAAAPRRRKVGAR